MTKPERGRRVRDQLEQKVTEMLAGPLGELGAQLQSRGWLPPALGGFRSVPISREAHAVRMREVLERDRALLDSAPSTRDRSNADVTEPVAFTFATQAPPQDAAEAPRAVKSAVVLPKPADKRTCSEPIRTRTMAKLLLSQGHPQRALSIYESLIAEGANDPALLAEADALRSLQT